MWTLYESEKIIQDFKNKKQYKEAIDYLERALQRHSQKNGLGKYFLNKQAFLIKIEKLKQLRADQCITRAKMLLNTVDLPLERCRESLDLLKEAGGYTKGDSDEAKLLKKQAEAHIHKLEVIQNTDKLLATNSLESARKFLTCNLDVHPEADQHIAAIDDKLKTCRELRRQCDDNIAKGQFAEARRLIEELQCINSEYNGIPALFDAVSKKEKIQKLVQHARDRKDSKQPEELYSALKILEDAKTLDPDCPDIDSLMASFRIRLGKILCTQGNRHLEQKKDIVCAIAAYKEAVQLGGSDTWFRQASEKLATLQQIEAQIASAYREGYSAGNNLEAAMNAFERAKSFGFHYNDLDQQYTACKTKLDRCRELVSEARRLLETNPDQAVSNLQNALIDYPAFTEADDLLKQARRQKKVQDAVARVELSLEQKAFSYEQAAAAMEALEKLDPHHPSLHSMKPKMNERAVRQLETELEQLSENRRLTEAVRRAGAAQDRFDFTDHLKKKVRLLQDRENAARKEYQDGSQKISKARECDVEDENCRESLYSGAMAHFEKALNENLDLRYIVHPERENLENEHREWKILLAARRCFAKGEYEACLEMLNPFQAAPRLKETAKLIMDAVNRLGFSGRFAMVIEKKTYIVMPDDTVYVGRNTADSNLNQIVLNLQDVSRKHGIISRSNGRFYYEDRPESAHGTKRNGAFMDRKTALENGDILSFGFFREEDGSPTSDDPAALLAISVHPPTKRPSLKVQVKEVDHPDFCEDASCIYVLIGEQITIGRGKDNAVGVDESSLAMRHLAVTHRDDRYWISDLGTPGGSFVNGIPLTGERALKLGDVLKLGNLEIEIVRI